MLCQLAHSKNVDACHRNGFIVFHGAAADVDRVHESPCSSTIGARQKT